MAWPHARTTETTTRSCSSCRSAAPRRRRSGGDAPYDSIVNGVPYDLEDYWTQVYPELTDGQAWPPLAGIEAFNPDSAPMCGDQSAAGLSRCSIACQTITWAGTTSGVMPQVYRQGGDYAVATLLATQYGLAALTRLGDESDEKTSTLRGDCLAGGYTASVLIYNRPETSTLSHLARRPRRRHHGPAGVPRRRRCRAPGRRLRAGCAPSAKVSSTAPSPAWSTRAVGHHAGRGTAASVDCPIHVGMARRTSAAPDT